LDIEVELFILHRVFFDAFSNCSNAVCDVLLAVLEVDVSLFLQIAIAIGDYTGSYFKYTGEGSQSVWIRFGGQQVPSM